MTPLPTPTAQSNMARGGGALPAASAQVTSTRLAVLGDLHLYKLWIPPWRLLCKRMLGQINLWWDRRKKFDPALLPAMLDRAASIAPDLMLLTGDVTMTSYPGEFDLVREALSRVAAIPKLGIPGNHDRYTHASAWFRAMERGLPGLVPEHFPHVRSLTRRWRLLVLDAARPRFLSARGRVPQAQLREGLDLVRELKEDDGLIVMCHYPAVPRPDGHPTPWQHRLANAESVLNLLRGCRAKVVYLHGHVHKPWLVPAAAGIAKLTDLNVGAPIMRRPGFPHGQGFWQLDLSDDGQATVAFTHHVPQAVRSDKGNRVKIEWESRRLP